MPTFPSGSGQAWQVLNATGLRQNNHDAQRAPEAMDDVRFGYERGSRWWHDGVEYVCKSNVEQAADWVLANDASAIVVAQQAIGGVAAIEPNVRKLTTDAARAPLPTDDASQGYEVGSRWLWQGQEWVAAGVEAGAARWISTLEVTPQRFGARGDGVADDTDACQAAIDWLYDQGGGTLRFPSGVYRVRGSSRTDTLWNVDVSVSAGTACLIVCPGVSLICDGNALIYSDDPTKTVIYQVEPTHTRISGLEIAGGWTFGMSGAGHGIFTVARTSGAVVDTDDCEWSDLTIRNVASYGLGLQNGNVTRCTIRRIRIDYTGADGLDLKSRSGTLDPIGNTVSDVVVTRHGNRVTGAGGIDCRGVWNISCVTVKDFGAINPANSYVGIRFRTKPAPTDGVPAGERGSLSQFYVDCSVGTAAGAVCDGVVSGSDDVTIQSGFIRNARDGVSLTGNANGAPERNKVIGVTSVGAARYSFYAANNVNAATISACVSMGALVAGYRNEGLNTSLQGRSIGDAAPITTSTAAATTELARIDTVGGNMAETNNLGIQMVGADADIDLRLITKGTGRVRFGTFTAQADAPVTGYVTIRDDGGNVRKLAVIA